MNCLRKYRRVDSLEERNLKMRKKSSYRGVIQIIRDLGHRHNNRNTQSQNFKIGDGNNRITKILARKAISKNRHNPIIVVPNEVKPGGLNFYNAKEFLVGKSFREVSKEEENKRDSKKIYDSFKLDLAGVEVTFEIWDDIRLVRQRNRIKDVVALFIKVTKGGMGLVMGYGYYYIGYDEI